MPHKICYVNIRPDFAGDRKMRLRKSQEFACGFQGCERREKHPECSTHIGEQTGWFLLDFDVAPNPQVILQNDDNSRHPGDIGARIDGGLDVCLCLHAIADLGSCRIGQGC